MSLHDTPSNASRGQFGTRLGVILASAGSAVGLGNVWRFPMEVGRNGGAAFILVYIAFVFLLAMPVMLAEFAMGRRSGANTVGAYKVLAPGRWWIVAGYLGVLGGTMVLSFYSVVAGWILHYTSGSIMGDFIGEKDYGALFSAFSSHPFRPLVFQYLFLILTHVVVARGVEKGIERFSKLLMPILLCILVFLVIYSFTMPGASEGLAFLLHPDFSKVTPSVVFSASGQAFFSLSVGLGCLATYASYFKRSTPLVSSAFSVCALDSLVAILSGFIIFSAVFSVQGVAPDAGPSLVFITLPHVFNSAFAQMPAVGWAFSSLFYVLLLLAALTSTISMHEIGTAFIREQFRLSRSRAAVIVTIVCALLGTACSLSFGAWKGISIGGMGVFDLFDFLTAKFLMPLGGIMISLFVGWWLDRRLVTSELTNEGTIRVRSLKLLIFLMRWIAPTGVGVVFVYELLSWWRT